MDRHSLTWDIEHTLDRPEADWLLGDGERQSFGKIFCQLLEKKGLDRPALADRMYESPFSQGADTPKRTKRDSLLTKLGRWAKDEAQPEDRDELFQMCILMGLDTEDARRLFDEGLMASWVHMANRRELIYLYCLDFGGDIHTAYALIEGRVGASMPSAASAAPADLPPQTVTRQMSDDYAALHQQLLNIAPEKRMGYFEDFLRRKAPLFHAVRQKRMRIFQSYFEGYQRSHALVEDIGEADLEGNTIYRTREATIKSFADDLRAMRIPDAADVQRLREGGAKEGKARKSINKLLRKEEQKDNPIRKNISPYLRGEKDIPRDIFIKAYILSGDEIDFYDLGRQLWEAGYPDIYVRAADGFDALIYHVFKAVDAMDTGYEAAYAERVTQLMRDLRRMLQDDRL